MSRAAAPPALLSALRSREKAAHGTMAFRFEKPSGWVFKAGQFLDMTLVDPPETDAEGNTRSFSIASGPHEDTLMIAPAHVCVRKQELVLIEGRHHPKRH